MKNRQLKIWQFVQSNYASGKGVMLLYVLESIGSSPGRQGFFMAVNESGDMHGSIGGGIMEHKFVELAKEKLQGEIQRRHTAVRKQVHNKNAAKNQSGMICSGEQTVLLYFIDPTDQLAIDRLIVSLQQHRNGTLQLSPAGIAFEDSMPEADFSYTYASESDWLYREKTGYKNQLTIIGGGHCSLALCRLMSDMDFYIRVYDDRNELKTFSENEFAHEKHLVNDYSELSRLVEPGSNHYVVIMTFGYRTDDIALRALVGKSFKYCGLLGSRSKTGKMIEQYKQEGINSDWLQRIHAPVGLQINSQTPEEIAISIAADIIRIKNAK